MRLVRLAQQPSRVADDIRAALASLGRGENVVGGIALIGVRPLSATRPVDAVVVLPRGVLIIIGVDLPDPAMHLEAPLTGQWKADGWPLVGPDNTANPATRALALAESIGKQLHAKIPESLPIGTIVAVGPYVEKVDLPAGDLAGSIRVLHPTPTSMLVATVSLASAKNPCSVEHARTLLKTLAPDAPLPDEETLTAEGFGVKPAEEDPLSAVTITIPAVPPAPRKPPPPKPIEVTAPVPRIAAAVPARHPGVTVPEKTRTVRWLPFAAIGLLTVLLVTAIVLATTGGSSGDGAPATATSTPPPVQISQGIQFLEHASGSEQNCAAHAVGDVQVSLQRTGCALMRRGSYEATVDGRPAAVSIAVVFFTDEATATAFKKIADAPGGGGITDLASETGKWPRTPQLDGVAYTSSMTGSAVRLVLTAWFDGTSSATDPALVRTARAALGLSLS